MTLTDVVLVIVLACIFGFAAWYVYKEKKRGKKCIGCPDNCGCDCTQGCSGCCKKVK